MAKIASVITKSTKAWSIYEDFKMSGNYRRNKYVCSRNRSRIRMTEYQEADCSREWMQQLGNKRRPTVAIDDMPEPPAGVMRMSADDDDQADQQRELADLGMAETDHSVLETP